MTIPARKHLEDVDYIGTILAKHSDWRAEITRQGGRYTTCYIKDSEYPNRFHTELTDDIVTCVDNARAVLDFARGREWFE